MITLHLLLLLIAFAFLLMGALDVKLYRINPLAMGLAIWMLSLMLSLPR